MARLKRSEIEIGAGQDDSRLRAYEDVLAAASRFARGLGGTSSPSGAVLASVTVRNYGTELEQDTKLPSRLALAIKDRPAWVMVFEKVPAPVSAGAYEADPQKAAARDAFMAKLTATIAAVVDARTGEFLTASTI